MNKFLYEKNKNSQKSSIKKLKNKEYEIEYTLDLHGFYINDAYCRCFEVINSAYEEKIRCILIITGKGSNSPIGRETIKSSFLEWMKEESFNSKIITFCEANNEDGGSGAFYILIKNKDKTKVY